MNEGTLGNWCEPGSRRAEIPTEADGRGTKLYLATVIDLYSRRLLGAATSLHPDAELTKPKSPIW